MTKRWLGCWVVVVVFAPGLACATLGGPESTVSVDAQKLRGDIKSTAHGAYLVHEMRLPSGTLLREYVAPGGIVFAVAWNGPGLPNLSQALGGYFSVYTDAVKAQPARRSRLEIRQPGFVMHSGGHMRAFSGRAYVPQALPAGVTAEEIR